MGMGIEDFIGKLGIGQASGIGGGHEDDFGGAGGDLGSAFGGTGAGMLVQMLLEQYGILDKKKKPQEPDIYGGLGLPTNQSDQPSSQRSGKQIGF
jgi:hypothetical protein